MTQLEPIGAGVALSRLRDATADLHRRLESRFNAIIELADPDRRALVIARYDRLYRHAFIALRPWLADIDALDFTQRGRMWLASAARPSDAPLLTLANRYQALGALYVIEGSTLGGRIILRELLKRGVSDPALVFLDPHGRAAGTMWRGLVAVIERETAADPARLDALCDGAIEGFRFAEAMLCGEAE